MMRSIIFQLHSNRILGLLLVVAYVLFIVFGHDPFVRLSVSIMNGLSLPVYNRVVAIVFLTLFAALLWTIVRAWRNNRQIRVEAVPFVLLSVVGLVVHFFVFTEMNIEFIHALEFGVLAVMLYAVLGRYGAALVAALPIMFFDEWYQFKVLYPETVEYFDLNDVVLDLWGSGLFLSTMKLFGSGLHERSTKWLHRPEFYGLIGIYVCMALLIACSVVVPYPAVANGNTWLVLNEVKDAHGFWRVHPLIGSTYHLLQPIPGLLMVFAICLVYFLMDPIRWEK